MFGRRQTGVAMTDAWWDTSEYERAVLSGIEASLKRSSPGLVRRFDALGGRNRIPLITWVAVILAWAGAAVVLATFSTSVRLALAGVGVMSGGLVLLVVTARRF